MKQTIASILLMSMLVSCNARWRESDVKATKRVGNVIIEALEDYREDRNRYPDNIADLVTHGYLTSIDPPYVGNRLWDYSVAENGDWYYIFVSDDIGRDQNSLGYGSERRSWNFLSD